MKKITTLSLIFLLTSIFINAQVTITVDNSVGADADYSDLQSAISAASSGDIIYVHASETNYGDISIDKSLTLIGYSHSDPDKKTMIDEINLLDNASNTTISGFHITNDFSVENNTSELTGIVIENNLFDDTMYFGNAYQGVNGMIIRGNVLYRVGSSTIWANYKNAIISNNIFKYTMYVEFHESVTIENNIFLNGSGVINIDDETGNIEIQDCIFYDDSGSTLNMNSDGVIFQNCLTYNLGSGSYTTLTGTGNLNNQNPQFVSATDEFYNYNDDYHLQAGSPAIGSGVSGDEMGIFNNVPFVFNNYGYTAGIPTVAITAITSQIAPGDTLEVTIESNSN